MNDDGTSRKYTPEDKAIADELIAKSESKAWAFIGTYLATEHPDFAMSPFLEQFIRMGILAGQIGTIETVQEMGLNR